MQLEVVPTAALDRYVVADVLVLTDALGLDAHRLEQIFECVAELLTVRVNEAVHLIEEKREDAPVAKLQE